MLVLFVTLTLLLFGSEVGAQDFKMTANQLYEAYEQNEVAADMKFKGKIVVTSGELQDINRDILGTAYIIIGGGEFVEGVQCSFTKSSEAVIAKLKKGQQVTAKGKVTGKMGFVQVENCEIQSKQNKVASLR